MTRRRALLPLLATATLALGVSACDASEAESTSAASVDAAAIADVWDSTVLHTFEVEYEQTDYDALMSAYESAGEKVWIAATVTIDGVTYEDAGLKLKGNSSLRGASSADDPATLPWIVRLDKYVDGQAHDGSTEFVIRGNSSETSLNEAIALELLDASGLAAQQAISVALTVDDGEPALRLVVENPDDSWMERELGDGALYKAEAGGGYDYLGDDSDAYAEVFDQEGGDDDLEPLIDFLEFVNNADDATFAAELADHLDVDAFATYLAFQELVDNDDDIDGRGNNSYLYFDPDTGLMTVVNWDLNLAYGATPGTGGGAGVGAGADAGDRTMPGGRAPGGAQAGAGGPSDGNILAARFLADDDLAALVDAEVTRLTEALYGDGIADEALDAWSSMLLDGATDLVPAETIESEASALSDRFPA
ncbi:CotH kinase family protein [Demequina sp. SYSU T00068]|uniref:CotH kinase family protein n=1 Tax=Demequina lignilytica TaxID=3051663 RepID=UPI002635774A|nr:CotH kinase family protein [Demequina sp. SYSU T00068]MDN4491017.1 CotH kinase family protein [Demequina sp. SYSU T00068]